MALVLMKMRPAPRTPAAGRPDLDCRDEKAGLVVLEARAPAPHCGVHMRAPVAWHAAGPEVREARRRSEYDQAIPL